MDMGWFIYVRRIKPKFVTVNYGCRHYEHLSIFDEPLFMLCKPNKSLSSFCFSIKTVPENQGKCNEMEFMPAPLTGNLLLPQDCLYLRPSRRLYLSHKKHL